MSVVTGDFIVTDQSTVKKAGTGMENRNRDQRKLRLPLQMRGRRTASLHGGTHALQIVRCIDPHTGNRFRHIDVNFLTVPQHPQLL